MAAGALTREVFGEDPAAAYMPHLSLVYSDMDEGARVEIAQMEQGMLLNSLSNSALPSKGFTVESIGVWFTPAEDRTLESWRLVKELPLSE
jgi:Cyclic phosphodiesterase-like protein